MTTLCTVTISIPSTGGNIGGSRASERGYVAEILTSVAQKIAAGKLSDTVHADRNGTAVASYTYTPVASK